MVIFLKDTSSADLNAIIEFIYKGSVNVAQTQLASFIKTAEALQIRGLSGEEDKVRNGEGLVWCVDSSNIRALDTSRADSDVMNDYLLDELLFVQVSLYLCIFNINQWCVVENDRSVAIETA